MKRRHFLATSIAALAGVASRRPQPVALSHPPPPDGWKVIGYTYAFGAAAHARYYGRPFFTTHDYGSVTGVGSQEVLGLPPGFRLIERR